MVKVVFFINICKDIKCKLGCSVKLHVRLTQHSRDKILLDKISNTLNCGKVYKHYINSIVFFGSRFEDIYNKIIPIFNKHKIIGIKSLDFQDFRKAAEIIKKGDHLTLKGLKEIKNIKSKMNKARYTFLTNLIK